MDGNASISHWRVWSDSPCGWHSYLLVREGRKYALLLSTEDAATWKLPLAEWRDLARSARPLELKRRRMAARLRDLAISYGHETALVKIAIALLKGKEPPP